MNSVSALTLLMLTTVAVTGGCQRQSPRLVVPTESDLEEKPAHESWGADFYLSKNGIPVIRISAPYTRRYDREDSTVTILTATPEQRVVAVIYDNEGETTATVHANEINYVEEQNRFDAYGAVEVVSEPEKSLETEHLYWLEETKMIYAPGFAKLYTDDRYIQGYELEASENLSSYTMARVTGQVEVEE